MIAEARVPTEQATRYLGELCRRLDEKARANPDLGVRVAWTETHGTVDLGWARCTVSADASTLTLRAESSDGDGVRQARELIGRHLEEHAGDDELVITWWQDGKPVTDTYAGRRDAMRGFHRRMRH
jgi:hypothetical protein